MSNDIQIFNNPKFGQIRMTGTSDEPLFCLADVCKAVELTNPSSVKARLDSDDMQLVDLHALNYPMVGNSMATFVNETGFYEVLLFSSSLKVKPFRKWITHEILPSIRKHGAYMTEDALSRAITEPDFLIQLATALKEEKKKRLSVELVCEEQKEQIENLNKKVSYLDLILASTNTVAITQIAQDYGMSGYAFNKLLRRIGVQYKVGTQWILYAKYKDKTYVSSETIHFTRSDGTQYTTLNTKWTQKGRLFLYEELKKHNIIPTIEKSQHGKETNFTEKDR